MSKSSKIPAPETAANRGGLNPERLSDVIEQHPMSHRLGDSPSEAKLVMDWLSAHLLNAGYIHVDDAAEACAGVYLDNSGYIHDDWGHESAEIDAWYQGAVKAAMIARKS